MKTTKIQEIKDEVTFPMERHRVTTQADSGEIATGDYKDSKHEADKDSREKLGEILSEKKDKKE
jgi:hypothetical protein